MTQLLTAVIWHFEVCAGLLLLVYHYRATRDRPGRLRRWMNRIDGRRVFTAIGLSMHLGILVLLEMGPFSWISMAYYIVLWSPQEWEHRLAQVLPKRLRFELP